MKIKSPYSNTFGMYCLLPFHSMTVNFDEKHLTFWILGNAFYGTPGIHGIMHVQVGRKDDIFRQRRLNHSGMGEGDYRTQSHAAEPYSCLQVWVFIKVNIHHEYDLIWKDSLHAGFYFWKNVTVSKEARKMSIFVHSFFLLLWLTFPPLLAQITSSQHSSWTLPHISTRRRKCEPEEK